MKTFFRDEEAETVTPFVQEVVYKRHAPQINEVCIFLTPEAKKKTYPVFQEQFPDWKVRLIDISNNCSFEEFMPLLIENIREEEIVVDVTHCFRSIPIRLLLALTYAEQMKNVDISHIYYGQMLYENGEKQVVIEDIIEDYNVQKVSVYLSEFNDTLTISSQNWEQVAERDKTIRNFLSALAEFNQMIELSEFDRSMNSVQNIVRLAREVERNPDKYVLLIPLVKKILSKLDRCTEGTIRQKKAQLIRMLLAHRKYQVAVTFTDQFFREELAGELLFGDGKTPFSRFLKDHPYLNHHGDSFAYKFSQYLMFCQLNIRGKGNLPDTSNFERDYQRMIRDHAFSQTDVNRLADKVSDSPYRGAVAVFFDQFRNRLNHGQSIQNVEELKNTIEQVLSLIESL